MTEAVHVATAIRGGASLVHGLQMLEQVTKPPWAHSKGGEGARVTDALTSAVFARRWSRGNRATRNPGRDRPPVWRHGGRRWPIPGARSPLSNGLDLSGQDHGGDFDLTLAACGAGSLRAGAVEIFQINLGKLCNMTCRHCHVDAGPDRVRENMDRETVDACLAALDRTRRPHRGPDRGRSGAQSEFPLPRGPVCRTRQTRHRSLQPDRAADAQATGPAASGWRNGGSRSCARCRTIGAVTPTLSGATGPSKSRSRRCSGSTGRATDRGDPRRRLTLMVNPVGAHLTGDQCSMERTWKDSLERHHGVTFDRLIALNNMPIARYLEWLEDTGNLAPLHGAADRILQPGHRRRADVSQHVVGLVDRRGLRLRFQPDARSAEPWSGWWRPSTCAISIRRGWMGRTIVTGRHCFGCTAGAGSSCGGAIHDSSE